MKNVIILLLISVTALPFLNSCASVSKVASTITVDSGEIPPDMATEKFVLIGILEDRKSYDKYVVEKFNGYTGEYVLTTLDEMDEKYPDVNKYRYYMHFEKEYGYSSYNDMTTVAYRYYIYDRVENETYQRKGRSSFFAKEMEGYLMAIDRVRAR